MTSYDSVDFNSECKGRMALWFRAMIWLAVIFTVIHQLVLPVTANLSAGRSVFDGIPFIVPVLLIAGITGLFFSCKFVRDSGWHCALPPVKTAFYIPIIAVTALLEIPLICHIFLSGEGPSLTDRLKIPENWQQLYIPAAALVCVYLLGASLLTMCFALCKTIKEGTVIIPSRFAGIVSGIAQTVNKIVFLRLASQLFPVSEGGNLWNWIKNSVSAVFSGDYPVRFSSVGDIESKLTAYTAVIILIAIAVGFGGTAFGRIYRSFNETISDKGDGRNRLSTTGYCVWCQEYSVPLYRVYRISHNRVRPPSQKLLTDNGFEKLKKTLGSGNISGVNVDAMRSAYVMSGSANPIADINERKVPLDHWCCQRCGMTVYESLRGYSGSEPAGVKIVGSPSGAKASFCAVIFRDYASRFMRHETAEYAYFSEIASPLMSDCPEVPEPLSPDVYRTPAMTFRYENSFIAMTFLSDAAISTEVKENDVVMVFIDAGEFADGSGYYTSIRDAANIIRGLRVKVKRIVIAVAKYDLIGRPELAGRCTAMDDSAKSSVRTNTFRTYFRNHGADVFEELWNECRDRCDSIEIVGHSALGCGKKKDSQELSGKLGSRHINETLEALIK